LIVTSCFPPLLENVMVNCAGVGLVVPLSAISFVSLAPRLPLLGEAVTLVGSVELMVQLSVPPPLFFTVIVGHFPTAQDALA
jgi:hypothetical protein